jgi:hypothetical protein
VKKKLGTDAGPNTRGGNRPQAKNHSATVSTVDSASASKRNRDENETAIEKPPTPAPRQSVCYREWRTHPWGLGLNLGTLIFLAIYTIVNYCQLRESRRNNTATANAFHSQLAENVHSNEIANRAWLEVAGIENLPSFPTATEVKVNALIRNGGKTPAYKVQVIGNIKWRPDPLPLDYFASITEKTQTSITFIGVGDQKPLQLSLPPISSDLARALAEGRTTMYGLVDIRYRDVVRPSLLRRTELCGCYNPIEHTWKACRGCDSNNRME